MAGKFYNLFLPGVAVGANKVHADLYNATGSNAILLLHEVNPIVDASVAVVGVVGINMFLSRTTAVGTGGTAATRAGTAFNAPTISGLNDLSLINPLITARSEPTGGATLSSLLNWISLFGEETNSAAYNNGWNMARLPGVPDIPAITVPENSGIVLTQGAVAATGSVGWNITFEVVQK